MAVWLISWYVVTKIVKIVFAAPTHTQDVDIPLVIAHRGASGYVPEHTLGAYAVAIIMGTDFVEPDLVMTKDGQLVATHDNTLNLTTDVSKHPEFAHLRRTQTIDGTELTDFFTEDFTLAELKTLRTVERIPDIRPDNARLDGIFSIPTFQEIIDLVKGMESSMQRTIGIYPEIKHSTHFKQIGLPMEQLVVETLHKNGFRSSKAPVYIQSLEVNNLKKLKNITKLRLVQLYDEKNLQPFDQKALGTSVTYGDMATPQGLREVARYAAAVGPDKSYIIPRDADDRLGDATSFVSDAHAAGLKVHPYAFRVENEFLPAEYRSSSDKAAKGNFAGELKAYLATGIDGLFSDQTDEYLSVIRSVTDKH